MDKIDWKYLSANPNAIHLLEANMDKVDWDYLSRNPNAIHLLENNPYSINGVCLSLNTNGIRLIEKFPHLINWEYLSINPNAIHILEANQDKIDYFTIYRNPAIIEYDYEAIKKHNHVLHEQLIINLYHPRRIQKHIDNGNDIDTYLE
jgi:hypothetical protein